MKENNNKNTLPTKHLNHYHKRLTTAKSNLPSVVFNLDMSCLQSVFYQMIAIHITIFTLTAREITNGPSTAILIAVSLTKVSKSKALPTHTVY